MYMPLKWAGILPQEFTRDVAGTFTGDIRGCMPIPDAIVIGSLEPALPGPEGRGRMRGLRTWCPGLGGGDLAGHVQENSAPPCRDLARTVTRL